MIKRFVNFFIVCFLIFSFITSHLILPVQSASQRKPYKFGQFDKVTPKSSEEIIKLKDKNLPNDLMKANLQKPTACFEFCENETFDSELTQSSYLTSGDIGNDGTPEIVTSSYYDGYVAIFLQNDINKDYILAAQWDVTVGGITNGVRDVIIADVNEDNLEDLVVLDTGNNFVVAFLQTEVYGEFNRIELINFEFYNWYDRGTIADVNNDGKNDILLTYGNKVYSYLQNDPGKFTFDKYYQLPPSGFTSLGDIQAGDFNNDLKTDFASLDNYNNILHIWTSPELTHQDYSALDNVSDNLTVGDFNNDQFDDIAVVGGGTNDARVYWGETIMDETIATLDLVAEGDNINLHDAAAGDLDFDSKDELVITNIASYSMFIWKFQSKTQFTVKEIDNTYVTPGQVIIDSLNFGDETNDIAYGLAGHTAPPHAPVTVHFNSSQGSPTEEADLRFVSATGKINTETKRVVFNLEVANDGNVDSWPFEIAFYGRFINFENKVVWKPVCQKVESTTFNSLSIGPGAKRTMKVVFKCKKFRNFNKAKILLDSKFQLNETNEVNNEIKIKMTKV